MRFDLLQRRHIDYEAVLHIGAQQLVRFVDLLNRNQFDVRRDTVFARWLVSPRWGKIPAWLSQRPNSKLPAHAAAQP